MLTEEMKKVLHALQAKDPTNPLLKLSQEDQKNHLQPFFTKSSEDLIVMLLQLQNQTYKAKKETEHWQKKIRETLTKNMELEERNKELQHKLEIAKLKQQNAELQAQLTWNQYPQQSYDPNYQQPTDTTASQHSDPTGPIQGSQSWHPLQQQDLNQANQTSPPPYPGNQPQ